MHYVIKRLLPRAVGEPALRLMHADRAVLAALGAPERAAYEQRTPPAALTRRAHDRTRPPQRHRQPRAAHGGASPARAAAGPPRRAGKWLSYPNGASIGAPPQPRQYAAPWCRCMPAFPASAT